MFCRQELARLADIQDQIRAKGATIAVISMSNPTEAKAICDERAPGVACYSDEPADSYDKFGVARASALQAMGPQVWLAAMRASSQGYKQGKTMSDPLRLSGTFVVGTDQRLKLAYYARYAGDAPSNETILNAL